MTTAERIDALTKELLLSRCDHYASPEFYACGNCIRDFLAEKLAEEREACAVAVDNRRCRDSETLPVTVKAANHALRLAAEAIRERQ